MKSFKKEPSDDFYCPNRDPKFFKVFYLNN